LVAAVQAKCAGGVEGRGSDDVGSPGEGGWAAEDDGFRVEEGRSNVRGSGGVVELEGRE
jgi:hypothetical protein